MSRNGSGTYTFPSNSFNPAVAGTEVDATDWNSTSADLATALSASIANDGQTATTAEIPLLLGVKVNNTGLKILDTNASHTLAIVPGSDLTANRTLTIITGDAAGTLNTALPTRQNLTSGSSATYTTPANARQLRIRMVGAGGGSGGGGASSGSTAGGTGGTTTFNSINAVGGGGGGAGSASASGSGGIGGTGGTGSASLRAPGQGGGGSTQAASTGTGYSFGPPGGSSLFGGGAPSTSNAGVAGAANSGGGASAPSGSSAAATGASGGGGEYVELIINSPSGTYTYTIGAGGTAGAAGTGGTAGAIGGSGVIIVDEIY